MDRLEKRIVDLEKWVGEVVSRANEWYITSEEAVQIFDILAEAGAVEYVMFANPDYQPDWQAAIV